MAIQQAFDDIDLLAGGRSTAPVAQLIGPRLSSFVWGPIPAKNPRSEAHRHAVLQVLRHDQKSRALQLRE
jgi:hypothetical protein